MSSSIGSVPQRPITPKAPAPSPALLSLQEQGLELPTRKASLASLSLPEQPSRVSPLSIQATPPNLDKPLPLEPQEDSRRPSSTYSVETTVSGILQLYSNPSQLSLKHSEDDWEEMTPFPYELESNAKIVPTFHQPRAYRDTIAPLLQHQHGNFTMPSVPSPNSFASLPRLQHPSATVSVPSLQLTPEGTPALIAIKGPNLADSALSLRLSPGDTPPFSANRETPKDTMPDVGTIHTHTVSPLSKDKDDWSDEPVSPMDDDSPTSPQSPGTIQHQRQLAYDSLSPPFPRASPNVRPVSFMQEDFLPGPMSATVTHVVDPKMVPAPLELPRISRSLSTTPSSKAVAYTTLVKEADRPTSEQATVQHMRSNSSLNSKIGLLPPFEYHSPHLQQQQDLHPQVHQHEHPKHSSIPLPPHRPSSQFSKSSDSFIIYNTVGEAVKAKLKDKFGRGKKKQKGKQQSKNSGKGRRNSRQSYTSHHTGLNEKDDETMNFVGMEYPGLTMQSPRIQQSRNSQDLDDESPGRKKSLSLVANTMKKLSLSSTGSGPGPAVSNSREALVDEFDHPVRQSRPSTPLRPSTSTTLNCPVSSPQLPAATSRRNLSTSTTEDMPLIRPRRRATPPQPQPAIPLTPYQKYGVDLWYSSGKKRRRRAKEAAIARKAAALEQVSGQKRTEYRPGSSNALNDSRNKSVASTASALHKSIENVSLEHFYDVADFEKKKGVATVAKDKLMKSAEAKRREKMKDSITVIGGGFMDLNPALKAQRVSNGSQLSGSTRSKKSVSSAGSRFSGGFVAGKGTHTSGGSGGVTRARASSNAPAGFV